MLSGDTDRRNLNQPVKTNYTPPLRGGVYSFVCWPDLKGKKMKTIYLIVENSNAEPTVKTMGDNSRLLCRVAWCDKNGVGKMLQKSRPAATVDLVAVKDGIKIEVEYLRAGKWFTATVTSYPKEKEM